MSDPKYLLKIKAQAEKALGNDPPDGLAGFSLAWTLWEAVRRRILILACKREGWTVKQARDALLEERIDNNRFIELYESITMGSVWHESLPLAARKLWPGILKAVYLRKRIIHGTTRIGEENLLKTAWNVLRFVNSLHEHALGNPLKELPKRSKKVRSLSSLRERLEMRNDQGTSS